MRFRKFRANGDHRVNPAAIGKAQIHERDVRLVLAELVDALLRVGRLGHHLHVRLIVDDCGDALTQ